jgi:hypothetical protein
LEYDGFDALIAQLERDLGAPMYRYITDNPGRVEDVEWRSESESIRLWTAHNCARPIGCKISLRWADENTKTLLEERRAYFVSQRPVVSNLSPTEAQFAAGAVLLEQLKRVYELEAVVPRELRSKLSTVVESNEEANGAGVPPYRVVSSLPNIVVKDTRYTLGTADAPRGGSFSIRIDDHAACVTEELLRKAWGKETNRFSPLHHHRGSANYLLPKGLRSPSVYLTYSTPQLINVTFHFDFVHCTQSISIDDRMPRIK